MRGGRRKNSPYPAGKRPESNITNARNSDDLGTLDVKIYTPKDVIRFKGKVPKEGADGFMSTCDKWGGE